MRRVVACGFALLLPLTSGCGIINDIGPSTCDRSADDNEPVLYTGGFVDVELDGGAPISGNVYRSSLAKCDNAHDVACELLHFPGGMRYQIEHKLGRAPDWWQFNLSFDRFATVAGADGGFEEGTLAPASGNQAELRSKDAEHLVVVNGSCSDYWLLVVAGVGIADAGSDAGTD